MPEYRTLISTEQLADLMTQGDVLIFDCRFVLGSKASGADPDAGRRAYEAGHLPGAFHADLERDLSSPHQPGRTGRHPLPPRADWQARMRAWGLFPDRQAVMYDDAGGAFAARLWWMLRWGGHGLAAVLDGGLQRWREEGRPLTRDQPGALPAGADYSARPPLTRVIEAEQLDSSRQLLLDARELPRFRGEQEPIDPVAGHIPGARCAAFSSNLRDGTFRSAEELRARFAALGAGEGREVVAYCGSGVTAAHNVLAMVHAGLPEPALYPGSWSEWITDPSRPVARGEG